MKQKPGILQRIAVPGLDKILGKPFYVLDDGFIRIIDYMGSDTSIVQAARVSYGTGTKKIRKDRDLIRYLMRHNHSSPFEMCEIKLHLRVPMDCWRQWIRHRTASINEYSTRYSEAIDSKQKTKPTEWRRQSALNQQGSTTMLDIDTGKILSKEETELHEFSHRVYNERLNQNVAREQARKDLPLSTYTEAYWKIDLNNLFHFLNLRMGLHAQLEIRSYANIIGNKIVRRWCPVSWEAFQEYRLKSLSLSSAEQAIIEVLIHGKTEETVKLLEDLGFITTINNRKKRTLECIELENKLKLLNLSIPLPQI
jgi:thymidylate synthase (FAD)